MSIIPDPIHLKSTAKAIHKHYEDTKENKGRKHLGASEIGNSCERALWYGFRWATKKQFEGRMLRLFETGNLEEKRFIQELRNIGVELHEKDPETDRQIGFEEFGGHFSGSTDGIGKGFPEAPKSWAVVEFKTHSEKSFTALSKDGVQKSKPLHYAQMQIYMGKFELERAMYLACNKNTDDLYSEWIHFDSDFYESLLKKAERVIFSITPPEGISKDPAWYECKFCDHYKTCHEKVIPQKNCRTCASATPMSNGTWSCDLYRRTLNLQEQRDGCRSHLYIPDLIGFATPLDYQEGYVLYECKNGIGFVNATEEKKKEAEAKILSEGQAASFAIYSSSELENAPEIIISDPIVNAAKREFGGKLKIEK